MLLDGLVLGVVMPRGTARPGTWHGPADGDDLGQRTRRRGAAPGAAGGRGPPPPPPAAQ
jgi:hypothetical protein